jgi:hypothetical protein
MQFMKSNSETVGDCGLCYRCSWGRTRRKEMGKGAWRSGTEIETGNCNSNESIIWLAADTEAGTQQNIPFDSEHGAGWRYFDDPLNRHQGMPVTNWLIDLVIDLHLYFVLFLARQSPVVRVSPFTRFKCAVGGVGHPQHTQTGSNSSTIAADSSNGMTNTRCCRYRCMRPWWWVEVPPETCRAVSRYK